MSGWRGIWEVARRELVERSRSRTMRISLALLLVLAVAGSVAAARVGNETTPTDDVALVGARSVAIAPALRLQAKAIGRRVELHRLNSVASASRAVRDGHADVALVNGTRLIVKRSRTGQAVRVVEDAVAARGVLARLTSAGLSKAQAVDALTPHPLPIDILEPGGRNNHRDRDLLSVGIVVLLAALFSFGTIVASSVIEEKSSRVIELLLTTVRPRRLLAGKVIGVGLLGLAQLIVVGAAALLAGRLAGGAGLPSGAPKAVALVVLWFALGYVFFSVAYAAVGSLLSRPEDLDSAALPINGVLIGAFVLGMLVLESPNGTLARVAAFLPPFAPMIVPSRVVLGDMGPLGLSAAISIELLATVLLIMLAARVYERAVLRIGAPLSLRGALGGEAGGRQASQVAAPLAGSLLGRIESDRLLRSISKFALLGAAIAFIADGSRLLVAGLLGLALLLWVSSRRGKGNPLRRFR